MDWGEIRKFVEESGGRALIVIDGHPSLIVSSYRKEPVSGQLDYSIEAPDENKETRERPSLMIDDLPL